MWTARFSRSNSCSLGPRAAVAGPPAPRQKYAVAPRGARRPCRIKSRWGPPEATAYFCREGRPPAIRHTSLLVQAAMAATSSPMTSASVLPDRLRTRNDWPPPRLLHVGNLIQQRGDTPLREPLGYDLEERVAHPGSRAVREHVEQSRAVRPQQQPRHVTHPHVSRGDH